MWSGYARDKRCERLPDLPLIRCRGGSHPLPLPPPLGSAVGVVGAADSGAVAAVAAAMREAPCAVTTVDAAALYRAQEGDAEAVLERAVETAGITAPTVLHLRHADALFDAATDGGGGGELSRRLWLLLLRAVARVAQRPGCVVIGAKWPAFRPPTTRPYTGATALPPTSPPWQRRWRRRTATRTRRAR